MLSESDALARVVNLVPASVGELLPIEYAVGRWAAEAYFSSTALPGFDHSAMDGYAVHASACDGTKSTLRITGSQPAGLDREMQVGPSEAVRIFTGASLPRHTGAIVMQEDVTVSGNEITLHEAVELGEFIRRAGSDVAAGQLLVQRGDRITPAHIGVLAAVGCSHVKCGRLPRIHIITTGDELITPGLPLPCAGYLYNSNGPMLRALVQAEGVAGVVENHHVCDDLTALTDRLSASLSSADIVIISGGASVGDHDHVRPALEHLGLSPSFWRVRVKPGKPFLFAATPDRLVFGLPGNPVSSFVTAHLFVLPALRQWAGASQIALGRFSATCTAPVSNHGDRPHYLRGRFNPMTNSFTPIGNQQSHAIFGLSQSNALACLQPDAMISAGDIVQMLLVTSN